MNGQVATRRRGMALEEAILDATWSEIQIEGYSKFTFEAVVKRAGTSRPVLYRRWPTRVSLASAALARQIRLNPLTVPDLGSFRDEVCQLMRKFADRAPPQQRRLIFEMHEDLAKEKVNFLDSFAREDPLKEIVERAIARGEVDPARLTRRILRVPLSLVLHEIVITFRPISDDTIAEIVDQIFLPLVVPNGSDAVSNR